MFQFCRSQERGEWTKELFGPSFPPVLKGGFQAAASRVRGGAEDSYLFWNPFLDEGKMHPVSKAEYLAPLLIPKLFFLLRARLFRKRK